MTKLSQIAALAPSTGAFSSAPVVTISGNFAPPAASLALSGNVDQVVGVKYGAVDALYTLPQLSALLGGGGVGVTIPLNLALGTITTNVNALNITGTWNNAAVTFDAPLFMNITNTASAAGSLLMDLQVGGTTAFGVSFSSPNVTISNAISSGALSLSAGAQSIILLSSGVVTAGSANWAIAAGGAFYSHDYTSIRGGGAGGNGDVSLGVLVAHKFAIYDATSTTTASGLEIYNTVDTVGSPTNYERIVIDWTTTANTATIGTQAGGTGAARNVTLLGAGGLTLNSVGTDGILTCFGTESARFRNSEFRVSVNLLSLTGNADAGITRTAAGVVGLVGSGFSAAGHDGWMNWAGETRVTADFSVTSNVTLANVTGLSVNVAAGRTYSFSAYLTCTCAAAGGVKAAIAGTATATNIIYDGYTLDTNATKGQANSTALAGTVGSTTTTATAGVVIEIAGVITVNAAGTLTVQFAQNTSNATASIVKRGSYMIIHDMP